MMMKVAIISHHFPPHYKAGAEQYAYRIAQELKQHGCTVEVVCIESITEGTLVPSCITDIYEDLLVHRLYFDIRKAPDRFEWSFRNPELGNWMRQFLQRFHPEVVHINSGYLLGGTVPEAAYDLGIPTLLTLHDYWFLCPLITLLRQSGRICEEKVSPSRCAWCLISEKRRYRLPDQLLKGFLGDVFVQLNKSNMVSKAIGVESLIRMIGKRRKYLMQVLEKIDIVFSPSLFLIKKFKEYGLQSRKIIHLPYGINKEQLTFHKSKKSQAKFSIGYLGQIVPHKGVHLLLNAFKRLKKQNRLCELRLHGGIDKYSSYGHKLRKIAANDPDIQFAGRYSNSRVGQILNNLDVIVVPSIWYELRPTVIVEALATQTPVIASAIGGIPELIKHNQNGLLFEAGSVKGLAEQLERLLGEPALLSQLRQGLQPLPTVQEEVATLISLYESLLSPPP